MKSIDAIEGIGQSYAEKLQAAGIRSTKDLLAKAGSRAGRSELANDSGISEKLILKWVNMADLFRIKGVAGQYAELLERSGVDTVRELAQRNPKSLYEKMAEVNESAKVVRQIPALGNVHSWVVQAKTLKAMVSH